MSLYGASYRKKMCKYDLFYLYGTLTPYIKLRYLNMVRTPCSNFGHLPVKLKSYFLHGKKLF